MSDIIETTQDLLDPEALVEVTPTREPTPYEKKLRTEARQHRMRAQEAERHRDEAVAKAIKEAESKVADIQSSANQRIVRAELKAHAVKAGIVDLDGLKLLDIDKIKMNAEGEVEGAEEVISNLRTAKPWLFGQNSSSSSAKPPAEQNIKPKNAKDMSQEEWRAARAEVMRRR
jgi:hypothetical protein